MSEQRVGVDELLDRVRGTYARVQTHETYEAAQAARRCWWTSGTRRCVSATV